jgi:Sieve element occlusion C-terminus
MITRSHPICRRWMRPLIVLEPYHTCGYWQDITMVWFFWLRLESMLHSKMQLHEKSFNPNPIYGAVLPGNPSHGGADVLDGLENDTILLEVMSLLSYDSGGHPWAVFSHGLDLLRYDGRKLLECLGQFETWKERVSMEPYHTCIRVII